MYRFSWKAFIALFFILIFSQNTSFAGVPGYPQNIGGNETVDTTKTKSMIDLRFPFKDRNQFDYFRKNPTSPLFLRPPANIRSRIVFDPISKQYIIADSLGSFTYRKPVYMGLDEYRQYEFEKAKRDYWQSKFRSETFQNQSGLIPKLHIGSEAFDKIFGSSTISIRPQGAAELTFGININKNQNPSLPEKMRTTTNFDFDNNIQMNVTGNIGDKVRVGVNYDTKAMFEFENKTKLEYTGKEDEIIKKIEAGNVSLPLTGSLITGSQTLFGLKTEMQFGRLTVTNIFSQQKGESKSIEVEGGASLSEFELSAHEYEKNQHFFLSQYFYDHYDEAVKNLQYINSGVTITKVEVWVTNKTNDFENSRNIIAFMDLAEGNSASDTNIFNNDFISYNGPGLQPYNEINDLYYKLLNDYPGIRDINQATEILAPLEAYNFVGGQDYEKIENARKLANSEYTIHKQLGYISLLSPLNADEVLAVAFEYTIGGEVFRVGEFSNEITKDNEAESPSLFLKLLKGTNLSPNLPTWKLMMKNIYSIGAYQVNQDEFYLDILYQNDKTGTAINYIPDGAINGEILLKVLNLDKLNDQNDPQPDGVFDFVEGLTINSKKGKIIFPAVEPFGSYLRAKIVGNDPSNEKIADQYVYDELYSMTQSLAEQVAEKNKFFFSGRYQSSVSSEISLNAYNIPEGSVVVTANGMNLSEGTDYTVDYNMGTVKIINQGLLDSGAKIKISMENNSMFGAKAKTMLGSHLDYRINEDFNIGGTILYLKERPLTNKVAVNDEPIANTIWGLNTNYRSEVPFLTKLVDKIPLIQTKERSNITFTGEFAHLIPGHSKVVKENGEALLDDFEGSEVPYDIKTRVSWVLASTPQGQPDMFPEGNLTNDLAYGYNRAKLAWYNVDPLFLRNNSSTPPHLMNNKDEQLSHFTREIQEKEIFPYKDSPNNIPTNISVLNLAFYPGEKGPYNFDSRAYGNISAGVDGNGELREPDTRWGGIMRKLNTNDFESANIEYVEFWMMDPYVEDERNGVVREDVEPALYFNLGNISEDILKDSRKSFEQGMPTTPEVRFLDTTAWGRVPKTQSLVNAFNNDDDTRIYQDVGLDGLSSEDERSFFKSYLDSLRGILGASHPMYQAYLEDPANDDYHYYRGSDYDQDELGILERYKKYNGLERNSPTPVMTDENYMTLATPLPDVEDINLDNTLSEAEGYFQYKVSLHPEDMIVGQNFITDKVSGKNKEGDPVDWYQFKVPIFEPDKRIGSIQDFRSIRFIRMFLRGFNDPVILRFATLELVRGEWRKYQLSLLEGSESLNIPELTSSKFEITSVNIEENGSRYPVNYILPPGVTRMTDPTNPHMQQLNEQSIVLKVEDLEDGDGKAAYKSVSYPDMRQYKKLQMWIHAEAIDENQLKDDEIWAFVRIGSDYTQNYYEYQVPLKLTEHLQAPAKYNILSEDDRYLVWPEANHIEVLFEEFQRVKQDRNDKMRMSGSNVKLTTHYLGYDSKGNRVVVKGNPNLSNVKVFMLGLRNPKKGNVDSPDDDGLPKSAIVWMNELKLTDFDEQGGWAANARLSAKLADFATLNVSGTHSTVGFGSIEKKLNERSKEDITQYNITSNIQLGKFFPKKAGVRLPVFIGYSEGMRNPKYNPLDPDIPLQAALDNAPTQEMKDSILFISQDYQRRKSVNLTNISVQPEQTGRISQPKLWSVSNWSASYGFNESFTRNINTEANLNKTYNGSINYIFNTRPKPWEPFKKSEGMSSKYLKIIKDLSLNYMPKVLSFRTNIVRQYNEIQLRNISNPDILIEPTYNKNFVWTRNYDLTYDISRNLSLKYQAAVNSRIDEPEGRMNRLDDDYDLKRDSIWNNIKGFGRNTKYHHNINASYNVPLNKIPIFDWVTLRTSYVADYDWQAGPLTADTINLGNTVQNNNQIQISPAINLRNLYNKVGFIKRIDDKYRSQRSKKKEYRQVQYEEASRNLYEKRVNFIEHDLMTEEVKVEVFDKENNPVEVEVEVLNKRRVKITPPKNTSGAKIIVSGQIEEKDNPLIFIGENMIRWLLSVKNININYSEGNGTFLPGYLPEPQWFGQGSVNGMMAPGLGFVLGMQDDGFGQLATTQGWVTTDSTLNQAYTQVHTENLRFDATAEPITDLRISLSGARQYNQNLSQYYIFENGEFGAHSQQIGGNFTMSIIGIKTSFTEVGDDENYTSETFETFKNNRFVISKRLAEERLDNQMPGSPAYDPNDGNEAGYAAGYGSTSQEVLVPSFFAAYTGADPNSVSLDPFMSITRLRPNWNIRYTGLTKIDFFKKYLRSFSVNHQYKANYSIGNYLTNLYFDPEMDGMSYIQDMQYNFIPEFQIGSVVISESLSPLIGMEMTWINSLTTTLEYRRTRNISLSFANNQLMEVSNSEFRFGGGFRFTQVPITIKTGGRKRRYQSDINLKADLSINNATSIIRKLTEDISMMTSGQRIFKLGVKADYALSNKLMFELYYDQLINTPLVQISSYPTANTKIGFRLRFTLSD